MGTIEDEIRAAIGYDPISGRFWWIKDPRPGGKYAGKPIGFLDDLGYLRIKFKQRSYKAHRIAWLLTTGDWPSIHIDHKNGNPSDNRFANLREADRRQNMANRKLHSNNTSGVKGVGRRKSGWIVQICVAGERRYLGTFRTREEAVAVRQNAAKLAFGEFAREV